MPAEYFVGLLTGIFLVLFLLTERSPEIFVTWLATMLCLGLRQTVTQTGLDELPAETAGDVESAPDTPSYSSPDAESEYDGMALRAWRASVLALLSVPPLAFYAVWLLARIARANAPLRPANQWRVPAAWVFAIVALPLGAAWLAILALGPYCFFADTAQRLFDVSGTTAPPP